MAVMNMVQAINLALKQEMEIDKNVIVLGEDVGKDGGVFRVTEDLTEMFGGERVADTPLAELAIAGVSIGLAANGLRPVAEVQFDGFSLPTLDQMICHASRLRNRTRGRITVPMVLRFPYGGGIKALEHHSDSPETYFAHTPGLKVVIPSRPYDAKGLMVSSIRDPDPVVFMEPKRVYRAIKEEVPEEEYTIPLGKAHIAKSGDDVTLVGYGAMMRPAIEAAQASRHSVEVIDLRTIRPLDTKAVIDSVKKTGRCVIVHEAPKTLGVGAEISARISEKALLSLKAPVVRVTGYDVVMPMPRLEGHYLPDRNRVSKAISKVMEF